jgi:hypothetical protein
MLPAQGADERPKEAAARGKVLDTLQRKNASSTPRATKAAETLPLTFVIPRDTCQQGEPLQTLPLAKP